MTQLHALIGRATAVLVLGSAGLLAVTPAASASGQPAIDWQRCPAYSDDVLRDHGVQDARLPQARALLARLECATVAVPLDYDQPRGRQIAIALTRLRAVDQRRRLGVIALNPGGPGGSGYLMPIEVMTMNDTTPRLNDRYDLIGFDPRGVGYSTKVDCPDTGGGVKPAPGPLTEEVARQIYNQQVSDNNACGRSDPAFLGQLTTRTVARDLDRARTALRESKLSFLGVSWGTWLGVVYRSMFPGNAARMFLDSVAIPRFSTEAFDDGRADATERNFDRMAAWMARDNATYGFGTAPQQVRAAVLALGKGYDATPKQFTDLSMIADGRMVAILAGQDSPAWALVSRALMELRDTKGSTDLTAPPTIKMIFGGGSLQPEPQPEPEPTPEPSGGPEAPEPFNPTMNRAAFCNEDPNRPDFAATWAAYQQRLGRNPVTGRGNKFTAGCAGWPLPGHVTRVHRTAGSMVLSGHRYESVSPYAWTTQMHAIVGGTVFTVDDDVHGSVLLDPSCAAELVSYFNTGSIRQGCDGMPPATDGTPDSQPSGT